MIWPEAISKSPISMSGPTNIMGLACLCAVTDGITEPTSSSKGPTFPPSQHRRLSPPKESPSFFDAGHAGRARWAKRGCLVDYYLRASNEAPFFYLLP